MNIDEIKRFQAGCGVAIETARQLNLEIMESYLRQAMSMSAEYERLLEQVRRFHQATLDVE